MAHILLLESDKVLGSNVALCLKKAGHSVDLQVNPQEAVNSADNKKPDLVILDLLLAQHSGVEFLYEFRSYPDWQNIPVIIFSSLAVQDIKDLLTSLEHLDIVAFHYKPVTSMATLVYAVDHALQPANV